MCPWSPSQYKMSLKPWNQCFTHPSGAPRQADLAWLVSDIVEVSRPMFFSSPALPATLKTPPQDPFSGNTFWGAAAAAAYKLITFITSIRAMRNGDCGFKNSHCLMIFFTSSGIFSKYWIYLYFYKKECEWAAMRFLKALQIHGQFIDRSIERKRVERERDAWTL